MREKSKRCWAARPDREMLLTPGTRRVCCAAATVLLILSLLSCVSSPGKTEQAVAENRPAEPQIRDEPAASEIAEAGSPAPETTAAAASPDAPSAAVRAEKEAAPPDIPELSSMEPGRPAADNSAPPLMPLPDIALALDDADARIAAETLALAEEDLFPLPVPEITSGRTAAPLPAGTDLLAAVVVPEPPAAVPEAVPSPETAAGITSAAPGAESQYTGKPSAVSPGSAHQSAGTKTDARTVPSAVPLSRRIHARLGDALTISLDGKGWLFLGEKSGAEGVDFLSRTTDEKTSLFIFNTEEPGEFTLVFEYRDFISGESASEEVFVTVERAPVIPGSAAPASAAVPSAATGSPASAAPAAALTAGGKASVTENTAQVPAQSPELKKLADRYIADGRIRDALNLYLDNDKGTDPDTALAIGDLYLRLNEPGKALEYFNKHKTQSNLLYREKAVAGLMRIAIKEKDQNLVDSNLDAFLGISKVPVGEDLTALASFQFSRGYDASALKILESYLLKYPEGKEADWVYFTLGKLFETSERLKDYRKSVTYYRKVADDFPMSRYWNDAKDRISYIERHFFTIR